MIPKGLGEIVESDVVGLISNEVREGRTIEYKRDLPGNADGDKKEFLADASSFANTAGGDLIFGLEETEGLPRGIFGIKSADLDMECTRLDSIMASGLAPRIRYRNQIVNCADGKKVLVLRVEHSWTGPHRVIFKGDDRFYGRNSSGKYALDVNELRTAFTLFATAIDRMRSFRVDRIIALSNNQTAVPLSPGSKIVIHCIPGESFLTPAQYDLLPFYNNPVLFPPIGGQSWNRRFNFDGLLIFSAPSPVQAYTQLYRNGIIEAVHVGLVGFEHEGHRIIPSIAFEKTILEYIPRCLGALRIMGVNTPISVALTLTNTRGLSMATRSGPLIDHGYPIHEDTLVLPEVMVQDFSAPLARLLKQVLDLVWNSCGYASSLNFDREGNWTPKY